MRWLCYGGASICIAFYVAQIVHDIFICIPVQKDYNPKLSGHCLPSGVAGSVNGIFNVYHRLVHLPIASASCLVSADEVVPKIAIDGIVRGWSIV